jgi:hypothetical protein
MLASSKRHNDDNIKGPANLAKSDSATASIALDEDNVWIAKHTRAHSLPEQDGSDTIELTANTGNTKGVLLSPLWPRDCSYNTRLTSQRMTLEL